MIEESMAMMRTQTFHKPGCTSVEAEKIKVLLKEGSTPEQISNHMCIALECIESFVGHAPEGGPTEEKGGYKDGDPFDAMKGGKKGKGK